MGFKFNTLMRAILAGNSTQYMIEGYNLALNAPYTGAVLFSNVCYQMGRFERYSGSGAWTQDQGTVAATVGTDEFRAKISESPATLPAGTYTVYNPTGANISFGTYSTPGAHSGGYSTATSFTFTYTSGMLALFVKGSLTCTGFADALKVILPGYKTSWAVGDVWHTNVAACNVWNADYLTFRAGLGQGVMRMMDWTAASGSIEEDWTDRTTTAKISLVRNIVGAQLITPYELCIDLANRVGADPWICLPHKATPDYVTQFGNLVATTLAPGRRLWLEHGNEIWNYGGAWSNGTNWVDFLDFTKYIATANYATDTFTLVAHGLTNGTAIRAFDSKANNVSYYSAGGTPISWEMSRGVRCIVYATTANTFRLYKADGETPLPIADSQVELLYCKEVEAGKSQASNTNYGKLCLRNWDILDPILGVNNYNRLVVRQVANTSTLSGALAVVGGDTRSVASRATYISGAPYFSELWWFGASDIASGSIFPLVWTSRDTHTVHVSVYAAGASPSDADVVAGTGAISHTQASVTYTSSLWNAVTPSTAPAANVTPSTVTAGSACTLSASAAVFSAGDVGKSVMISAGSVFITGYTNPTTVTGTVIRTLSTILLVKSGSWRVQDAISGLTNGVSYKVYYALIDTEKTYVISDTVTVSATPSYTVSYDSATNQSLRLRRGTDYSVTEAKSFMAAGGGLPMFCYEGGLHNHETAPTEAHAWLAGTYQESPEFAAAMLDYLYRMAAAGVKGHTYYAEMTGSTNVFSIADSVTDTADLRYAALSGLGGRVAVEPVLNVGTVTAGIVATEPSYPYAVATLPAETGRTYTYVGSALNMDVSGSTLRLLSGVGVDWDTPINRAAYLEAFRGNLSDQFVVNFSTGSSWYEGDSNFVWSSIADTDTASINPIIGSAIAGTGTAAVAAAGLWNMQTNTQYSGSSAISTTPASGTPFLFAFVMDKAAQGDSYVTLASLGTGASYVRFATSGSYLALSTWFNTSLGTNIQTLASIPAGAHVHWVYGDGGSSPVFHIGRDQTSITTLTPPAASGATIGGTRTVGNGSGVVTKMGTMQSVSRAGMTLADAKAIVAKMQAHHGIA